MTIFSITARHRPLLQGLRRSSGRDSPAARCPRQAFPAAVASSGQAGDLLVRERANSIDIDPVSGEVLSVTKAAAMGWQQRWTHTADPLHFGGFGGIWSKVLWFISGLVLTALCFSGVAVYCLRQPAPSKP